MDRNRFNKEVRPSQTEIPIGEQGIAFDRIELDEYKSKNGHQGKRQGVQLWDAKERRASSSVPASGISTKASEEGEFARALAHHVKNKDDRLVVLNRIALAVVNQCHGQHATHVFTYKAKPVTRMLNSAWLRARKLVDLPQVRVHDLKHTFGRRLRAAGISFEDRQDLLGHRSGRITTHYAAAELSRLIDAVECVCIQDRKSAGLVVLR